MDFLREYPRSSRWVPIDFTTLQTTQSQSILNSFCFRIFRSLGKKRILVSLLAAVVLVATVVGLYAGLRTSSSGKGFEGGAVAANGEECAEIGVSIMKKGGSVADGAIATMLCEGITCPQSTGLGGGFFMTIYIKSSGKVETLDARETAPLKATEDMFVGNPKAALEGGLSIAVPGEVKGMWELHQKYGKLPWRELFEPNIELCRNGHEVTPYLARILAWQKQKILDIPSIREVFVDPQTNDTWKAGDRIKRLKLAETLEIVAKEGVDSIYGIGTVGRNLLDDIKDFGGILTEEDLRSYTVEWGSPAETTLYNGDKLYSMPLPGAGPIIVLIMDLLKNFQLKKDVTSYHRIIEAFKFAYGYRSDFGDPRFVPGVQGILKNLSDPTYLQSLRSRIDDTMTHDVSYYGGDFIAPEDHGTAHMSILAPNGDAIAVTGTINYM
jgi:gamma-glutamyltranspeptidase/glutathione hydrolase/leukotriene-C4 hydrolase